MRIKIASRKSDLARLQSFRVGEALKSRHPQVEIEYIFRSSLGDLNQRDPLWKMPEKGVFTEDFLAGLKSGEFDLVVHSWKDLPTETRTETALIATLPRADQRDLLLFPKRIGRDPKPSHWRILSSSPRREYNLSPFLKEHLPSCPESFEFVPVRGNITTRLTKLMNGEGEVLVVAKAALDRLLLAPEQEFAPAQELIRAVLKECDFLVAPLSLNPTAAAQGAIVVEARADRSDLKELLANINSATDFKAVVEERRRLSAYGGGCHLKIGISICHQDQAQFLFTRGLTPQGESFDLRTSLHHSTKVRLSLDEVWPTSPSESQIFERMPCPVDRQKLAEADAVLVARVGPGLEELLPLLKDKIIWTAGTKTWAKLAEKGLWVHGSLDSLGTELPELEHLALKPLKWVKLTHKAAAAASEARVPSLGYYELKPKGESQWVDALRGKKAYFWNSFSSFRKARQDHPELVQARQACGPGQTARQLMDALGHESVDVYLSHEEWLNRLVQSKE